MLPSNPRAGGYPSRPNNADGVNTIPMKGSAVKVIQTPEINKGRQ